MFASQGGQGEFIANSGRKSPSLSFHLVGQRSANHELVEPRQVSMFASQGGQGEDKANYGRKVCLCFPSWLANGLLIMYQFKCGKCQCLPNREIKERL